MTHFIYSPNNRLNNQRSRGWSRPTSPDPARAPLTSPEFRRTAFLFDGIFTPHRGRKFQIAPSGSLSNGRWNVGSPSDSHQFHRIKAETSGAINKPTAYVNPRKWMYKVREFLLFRSGDKLSRDKFNGNSISDTFSPWLSLVIVTQMYGCFPSKKVYEIYDE